MSFNECLSTLLLVCTPSYTRLLLKCLKLLIFSIFLFDWPLTKRTLENFPRITLISGFLHMVYQYFCYQQWWHMPLIATLRGRARYGRSLSFRPTWLSEFQDSPGYKEKTCLETCPHQLHYHLGLSKAHVTLGYFRWSMLFIFMREHVCYKCTWLLTHLPFSFTISLPYTNCCVTSDFSVSHGSRSWKSNEHKFSFEINPLNIPMIFILISSTLHYFLYFYFMIFHFVCFLV